MIRYSEKTKLGQPLCYGVAYDSLFQVAQAVCIEKRSDIFLRNTVQTQTFTNTPSVRNYKSFQKDYRDKYKDL